MHAALCSASPLMPNHRKQSSRIASRRSLPEGATLAKACNRCHERKIKCDGLHSMVEFSGDRTRSKNSLARTVD
ncbi:hypothetical protein I203_106868 [Kwoniella mangroviensis CBS 8507]|uniref:hypothetical protein n=1 Tax=Kwoniella mangroviensis CBS 8507 TaxID=1296122 RepID=UPI0030727463